MQVWLLKRLPVGTTEVYATREGAIAHTGGNWVPIAGGIEGEWVARIDGVLMTIEPAEVHGAD